jgi:signal transduction histidine kinase/ligand-binding sensor domain-containing protein
MLRTILIFFFITTAYQALCRQTTPLVPADRLSEASIFQWTGENGLISNNITSALQARTGFIWITTYNGIMRFDGKRVEVFDEKTIPFLATNSFYKVYEDSRGVLWFASQGSGIITYDGQTFTQVEPTQGTIPKSIRSLYLEDNGNVWIGTNNEGLLLMSEGVVTPIHHPALDNNNILDIDRDEHHVFWFATDGHGVVRFDGQEFFQYTHHQGLLSNSVNTVKAIPGEVLIGTTNGLMRLAKGKISAVDFLKNVPINDIAHGPDGLYWIAAENGLARFSTSTTEYLSEKNQQSFTRINNICFDKEGSAWLSTGRNGLIQIKQTGIVNFTTAQGLTLNRINIIVEGSDNSFYIGSDGGDVDVYKNGEVKKINLNTSLASAGIRDICVDNAGNLWIASYRGILSISGGKEKLYGLEDGLPAIDIRRILKDKKGNLWFGSRSGGVVKFSNNKIAAIYDKSNGLGANYILALEEDTKGNIYVGTHSGGLTVISPDGTTNHFSILGEDAGILIFNIHIANNGTAWLICNSGIYLFNGTSFKKIKLENPNQGETFFDLVEDANRNFWITTNIGVLRLKHADVENYINGTAPSIPGKIFDNQDGMINKECTGATRSLRSTSGRLWIPTIGGVTVFHPERIKENKIIPPVYITSLLTDKQTITRDSSTIAPGNLRFSFNFTALSYWSPAKVRFKYKLENVDPDWVDGGSSRQAEYTNLKPGRYTLRVIACNNDGLWNEQGATMHFIVQPFFYQTFWFYALSVVLALLVLYATYTWRIRKIEQHNAELRKLNNELDRFVYSTSHDLRAPLASILGLINLSRLEKENREEYLNLIEKSVRKLDEFISEIIDYSRNARLEIEPVHIDFQTIVASILEDLEYLEENVSVKKNISISGSGQYFNDKTRLRIILSNLISNAIKYRNTWITDPRVNITISYNTRQAVLMVEDNGIGIVPDQLENIFKMFHRGSEQSKGSGLGLYIVKETVDKLGGTVTVKSKVGEGTAFEVIIPAMNEVIH